MNIEQYIPYGLLYSVAPEYFAQLHENENVSGSDFDWSESANQFECESLASNVLEFFRETGTK